MKFDKETYDVPAMIRLTPSQHTAIKREATRLEKRHQRKVGIADVIRRALDVYFSLKARERDSARVRP